MKNIGKYCEDFECEECLKLYDKQKSSRLFCLVCQKIIAMITDSVACERYLKWKHLSCTFLKKLPKLDIAKFNLKISIWNPVKWSIKHNLTTRLFDSKTCPRISDVRFLNIDWKEEEKTLKNVNVKKLNKWKGKKWLPWYFFWLTVDWLHHLKQLKLTIEVFTREMFNDFLNLCIFWLFVISIINHLISDDADFLWDETRLPFYKWRYKYLLNLCDRMAMMKAMPLKIVLTRLVPYYINISAI